MGVKSVICLVVGIIIAVFVTAIPQPDYIMYGAAYINAVRLLRTDNATISLKINNSELVHFHMGDAADDVYILRVPMNTERTTGFAMTGDVATIYINNHPITEGTRVIGNSGDFFELNIHIILTPNGGVCTSDFNCSSNHCQNGFCCNSGDCCSTTSNCQDTYKINPLCDAASSCQGHRNDKTCVSNQCGTSANIDDDSGCTNGLLSDSCNLYVSVFCNGQQTQSDPPCFSSCTSDTQCDSNAHCDNTCVADLSNGLSCDENSDCVSNHCQNGFCCGSGDCCSAAANCPDTYKINPLCDAASSCQGHRNDKTCVSNQCGTSANIDDDSACTNGLLANECNFYPSLFCSGQVTQTLPVCASSCTINANCDPGAFCEAGQCTFYYNISLVQGWNLISLPVTPSNITLLSVLSSISGDYNSVFVYNASTKLWFLYDPEIPPWIDTLTQLTEKQGIWIYMKSNETLKVTGAFPSSTSFIMADDWNLISYPYNADKVVNDTFKNIISNFVSVFSYNAYTKAWQSYSPTSPAYLNTLSTMKPGLGYWVRLRNGSGYTFQNGVFN
jgi:hypothetical protein